MVEVPTLRRQLDAIPHAGERDRRYPESAMPNPMPRAAITCNPETGKFGFKVGAR